MLANIHILDETKCTDIGCNRGIYSKCNRHGIVPICEYDGCTLRALFKDGGIQGRCCSHGGFPLCDVEGCKSRVTYYRRQQKRCGNHGGHPSCSVTGCGIGATVDRHGNVKSKCFKHGNYYIIDLLIILETLFTYNDEIIPSSHLSIVNKN